MEYEIFGRPLYWHFTLAACLFYHGIWAFISYRFIVRALCICFQVKNFIMYMLLSFAMFFMVSFFLLPGIAYVVTFVLLQLLYMKFFIKQPLLTSLIISLLIIVLQGLSMALIGPLDHFLFIQPLDHFQYQMYMTMSFLLKLGVNWGLYYFIQRNVEFKSLQFTQHALFVVLPLLLVILSWQMTDSQSMVKSDQSGVEVSSSLSMRDELQNFVQAGIEYICIFSVFLSLQRLISYYQWEKERSNLLQQFLAQKHYIAEANWHLKRTRAFRHDLKNHFLVLQRLLEIGDIEEAKTYTEKFNRAITAISFTYQTGNVVIDALFHQKLNFATQNGIKVVCDVKLSRKISVDDFDLCIIFANAIDNAINACQDIKDKYILLSTKRKGDFLLIEIKNSFNPEKKQLGGSGMGIPNMQATVQKYQGIVETNVEKNCFCLMILLVAAVGGNKALES